MEYRIPLFDLNFDDKEAASVLSALDDRWISMGPRTADLEARFAELIGAPHAIAVTNCTAALHLALVLLEIGPGDEVIVPSLSFVATVAVVRYVGATPVFCDITGPSRPTIDPERVAASLTAQTKAVIAMHYGGFACQMDALTQIANRHGLAIIEDVAHAPLAEYRGRKLGTIGDIGCFSFFANKNMTTAEGGMIVARNEETAKRARLLRSHGMTTLSYERSRGHAASYDVAEIGYNYRLDDIRAAIGLAQIDKLDADIHRRAAIRDLYVSRLSNLKNVTIPFLDFPDKSSHYIFAVIIDSPSRDDVRARLAAEGIQTSVHYPAIHRFASFQKWSRDLPVTEYVSDHILALPMYASLRHDQIDFICRALATAVQ